MKRGRRLLEQPRRKPLVPLLARRQAGLLHHGPEPYRGRLLASGSFDRTVRVCDRIGVPCRSLKSAR